jgi:hypothetical protein
VSGGVSDAAIGPGNGRPSGHDGPLEYIAAGHASAAKGRFAAAAVCFENALALDPSLPMAHNNLGWVRQCAGDRIGALLSYRKALELNGSLRLAQLNLASLLCEMGRTAEARPVWRALLSARPRDRALLDEVISVRLKAGELSAAAALADRYARLCHGSQWFTSPGKCAAIPERPFPVPLLSARKLKHDIQQFDYLQRCGVLPNGLADVTDRYRTVLRRITPSDEHGSVELSDADRDLIGHVYNRIVHRRPAPRVKGTLSGTWLPYAAEDEYLGDPLGLVVVDNFLSEEALASLRSFCLESTLWFANSYAHGRLGAFFRDGFNCPLLMQIANDLRCALPRVIGEKNPLLQMWAFKYDHVQPATVAHADFASVNVNFWLTPDSANLNAQSGGMIIYDVEAPADWDFDSYNRRGGKISLFLKSRQPRSITIPYQANRAIIFNSDLFHATAPLHFRDSYEDRRINVTMLYGRRKTQPSDRVI